MSAVDVTVQPALLVSGVSKAFHRGPPWHRRTVAVLRDASLEVGPGELIGLVGENGSGKSTLMQVIVGLLPRDGGASSDRGAWALPPAPVPLGEAHDR